MTAAALDHRRATAERNATAILDAAERLMAARTPLSVVAIATEAGVSRPTVYAHFRTVADVVEAAVRRSVEGSTAAFAAARPHDGPPAEALRRMVAASWSRLAAFDALARTAADHLDAGALHRTHEALRAPVVALVERGQREGAFRTDLPAAWLTTTYSSLLHGAHGHLVTGIAPDEALALLLTTIDDLFAGAAAVNEPATFLFADIAGFTALTEAHGDEEAADLVSAFCAAVRAELPACGGTHVKTIGDALMLRVPDPADAVALAVRIATDLMHGHGAPAIRVGLHHGAAVERDGDFYGATVNLAARVSSVATGGEVLLTGHTAALAPHVEGIAYESRGRQELRNVREPVELFAAVRQGGPAQHGLVIDPVCQMAVDPERAPGRIVVDDTAYWFCSLDCVALFARAPDRYVV